ncbi:MAG: hypothetical protein LBV08_10415 [Clostridiales bacterium]|jgi:hypothetical protein|nr:hypothetical protein [Clostridiales bacterium]
MKKFLCSSLLVVAMAVTSICPVFASDAKQDFYDAIEKTSVTMENEAKVIEASDLGTKIYEQLLEGAYKSNFSLGVNQAPEGLDLSKLFLNNDTNAKGTDFTSKYSFNIPAIVLGTSKDFELGMDIYMLGSKLGISIPQLYDGYYYIDTATFVNDYVNSELNTVYPLDPETKEIFNMFPAMLTNAPDTEAILETTEAMGQSMVNLLATYKDRAFYTNDGKGIIDAKRGQIVTTKLSFNLNQSLANEFLLDFADFYESDPTVYNYFNTIYGNLSIEGENLAKTAVTSTAAALRAIKAADTLKFSVYTNETKHIYRYELDADLIVEGDGQSPINVNFVFDTKGKTYLLDEIYMDMAMTVNGDTAGFMFDMAGDIIPKQGVEDFDFNASIMEGGATTDFTITKVVSGSYYFDVNKKVDNFKLDATIMPSALPDNNVLLSVLGDIDYDLTNNSLNANFKNIKVSTGGNLLIDMFLKAGMSPSTEEITEPAGAVKITDLTAEQLNALLQSITVKSQGLVS